MRAIDLGIDNGLEREIFLAHCAALKFNRQVDENRLQGLYDTMTGSPDGAPWGRAFRKWVDAYLPHARKYGIKVPADLEILG